MDGSAVEHSDSDSGESWTLLENSSSYEEDAFEAGENTTLNRDHVENHHDDDTDGISIISDSDPESAPCDLNNEKYSENRPSTPLNTSYLLTDSFNDKQNIELVHHNQNDFMHDSTGKHKTYVHRRNKRLSTMLNIIMLGSVITAAGVAIGHMWGAKYECNMHATPSVNKILSSLYKLKEENAFLRSKLKELTNNIQFPQQKPAEKLMTKHPRCKKMFEQPINKRMERGLKCIDVDKSELLDNIAESPEHEKDFVESIENMRNIYNENKSWLNVEIENRLKVGQKNIEREDAKEKLSHKTVNLNRQMGPAYKLQRKLSDEPTVPINAHVKENEGKPVNMKDQLGPIYTPEVETLDDTPPVANNVDVEEALSHRTINLHRQMGPVNRPKPKAATVNVAESLTAPDRDTTEKKVTYADSLKSEPPAKRVKREESSETPIVKIKAPKKKTKEEIDSLLFNNSYNEDDIKKDDRYTAPRMKQERKKHDRQKLHKKQKRRNKYEQWEMKGGYLKDFDEFSVTSSLGNVPKSPKLNPDIDIYVTKFTETDADQNQKKNDEKEKHGNKEKKEKKGKDLVWYEKRSAMRNEARKRLEHELFGETSPNAASWYFRRMQKREQCRAQKDNSTFKKFFKQKMNFKVKH